MKMRLKKLRKMHRIITALLKQKEDIMVVYAQNTESGKGAIERLEMDKQSIEETDPDNPTEMLRMLGGTPRLLKYLEKHIPLVEDDKPGLPGCIVE